jgi:hypothetical protein
MRIFIYLNIRPVFAYLFAREYDSLVSLKCGSENVSTFRKP